MMNLSKLMLILILLIGWAAVSGAFPAIIAEEKPDSKVSPAVERLYDEWNPYEDRANELYSNFKYTPLRGLPEGDEISRRDPSKVLLIDGVYHVWYTGRKDVGIPVGPKKADDQRASFDWDLCDIWHATSEDGWTWTEDAEPAVKRPPKPKTGWRSISTPDILIWKGKYYLYYQAFDQIPGQAGGDRAAVSVAVADSPYGPWERTDRLVLDFGAPDDWDANAIHDPNPIVYRERIYIYYKGSPQRGGAGRTLVRAQGVAIAEGPLGPFEKSPLNPVINSGHETCMFPWKEGVAALVSLDGAEKNSVQLSADGIHFEVVSLVQLPPVAPGPFLPDAFGSKGNGRGFSWGLCHIMDKESGVNNSVLARFDCDLSLDVNRPMFKHNNLRFNDTTYFQKVLRMPTSWLRGERYP